MVCQWWPRGLRYIRCNTSGAGICRVSSKDDETLEARLLGISVFSDRGGFFWAVFWMVIWVLAVIRIYGSMIFVDERGEVCQLM